MAKLLHLELLESKKSLLAFSGGIDSSALFFMLLEREIDFDITIVNYNTRDESAHELSYANELAKRYNKKCFIHSVTLNESNFEHSARAERYSFFKKIVSEYGYDYLLTAHQLDDRLEWLLMQLCRGAGVAELLGVKSLDRLYGIKTIRPLLEFSKNELLDYLKSNNHKYFIDSSNSDEKYRRNYFRKNFATPLLEQFNKEIKSSFKYLERDKNELIEQMSFVHIGDFIYAKNSSSIRSIIYSIDRELKSIGYLISSHERGILEDKRELIVAREYLVVIDKNYTFMAPYIDNITMSKEFKEECRKLHIAPKLRGYLYQNQHIFEAIKELH